MVEMKGKNVLVVGMARSGVAAAQMLSRLGAKLTLTDTRTREQMKPAIEQLKDIQADWRLGTEPDDLIQGKDYIVLSPSVYYWAPWVERPNKTARWSSANCSWAPGSQKGILSPSPAQTAKPPPPSSAKFQNNGSRTHVLGNIGVPVCTEALDTRPGDVIVCETAPFMTVGNLDFRPKVSAILNLTEDHLNYFGTMENYINCKKKVYENQRGEDVCILNADDPRVVALRDEPKCRVLYFSRTQNIIQGACIKHGEIIVRIGRKDTPIMRADEVKIPGPHNLENALAAVLCAYVMGVKPEIIRHTLMTFAGVEHRIETVREVNGVTYINDSKATNPDSTIKAIQAMTKPC
ncbi:MAG: Mur ligase family protein [Christensenellales bacterium]